MHSACGHSWTRALIELTIPGPSARTLGTTWKNLLVYRVRVLLERPVPENGVSVFVCSFPGFVQYATAPPVRVEFRPESPQIRTGCMQHPLSPRHKLALVSLGQSCGSLRVVPGRLISRSILMKSKHAGSLPRDAASRDLPRTTLRGRFQVAIALP